MKEHTDKIPLISANKKTSYRIEKTIYKEQLKVIDSQKDMAVFTITFNDELSFQDKEQIMLKINSILNS